MTSPPGSLSARTRVALAAGGATAAAVRAQRMVEARQTLEKRRRR